MSPANSPFLHAVHQNPYQNFRHHRSYFSFLGDNSTNISHLLQDRFDQHKNKKNLRYFSRGPGLVLQILTLTVLLWSSISMFYLLTYFLNIVVYRPKQHCEKRPRCVVRCTCGARTRSITRRGVRNSRRGHKSDMKPTQQIGSEINRFHEGSPSQLVHLSRSERRQTLRHRQHVASCL